MNEIKPLFDPWRCKCGGTFHVIGGEERGNGVRTSKILVCYQCSQSQTIDFEADPLEVIRKFRIGEL